MLWKRQKKKEIINNALKVLSTVGAAFAISQNILGKSEVGIGTFAVGAAAYYTWTRGEKLSAEAQFHRDNIEEIGQSLQLDLQPQTLALQDDIVELKGNATQQYIQWKKHLKKIFDAEKTPDKLL